MAETPPEFSENADAKNLSGSEYVVKKSKERRKTLEELEIDDNTWRISARKGYGCVFIVLLLAQNAIVFGIVIKAFQTDKIGDIALVLTLIVNGTLIETAFIIKIIVQWLFSDINYRRKVDL